jgi:hypothetical protein
MDVSPSRSNFSLAKLFAPLDPVRRRGTGNLWIEEPGGDLRSIGEERVGNVFESFELNGRRGRGLLAGLGMVLALVVDLSSIRVRPVLCRAR